MINKPNRVTIILTHADLGMLLKLVNLYKATGYKYAASPVRVTKYGEYRQVLTKGLNAIVWRKL